MAIQREATDVKFASQPGAGALPSSVAFKSPNVDKFTDANRSAAEAPSALDSLVSAIVPAVSKLAQNEINIAREEAYLKGASAAAGGVAQEEIDSNIFTKDWSTAGYRDTRGRLAQADAEAQTAVDMKKLREQSPEEMQNYLAQRRQKLIPSLEGMSLEARKGFLAQQITSDRAAIAKHATEHQKFVIDQIGKSVQTDMSVRYDAMERAKADPAAYATAADDAYAGLYNNVWANPNLPQDVRLKLTTEAAAAALTNNHQVLYEKMRDTVIKVKGADGQEQKLTMLEQMPFDAQVKLSKMYKQSLDDTKAMRLGDFQQQLGLMRAGFSDPLAPAISYEDLTRVLQQGRDNGAIKFEDFESITKEWATGNHKKTKAAGLAAAYASGDVNARFAIDGATESEGFDAYIQARSRAGKSVAETTGELLQIGITTGQLTAFKGVGDLTRPAVNSLGTGAQIDPGQLQMLQTVLTQLDRAQANGTTGAMSAYLSSFDDKERAKIMMFREGLQAGKSNLVAAAEAADAHERSSNLTDTERNVLAQQHAKSDLAIVSEIEPRGLWGSIKNAMPNILRLQDNIDKDKISTGKGWFENPDRVQAALAQSKAAVLEELNYISRSNPYASDDSRRRLALAKVAERTIELDGGPLVLPRLPSGSSMQDFFGVPRSVRPDTIGEVLNGLHKPTGDNRVVYKMNGQAQLMWQEYGPNGELMNPGGVLDPKSIAAAVRERQDQITERFQRTDGRGVQVKGSDGSAVQFNGDNTIGAPNDAMLEFRQSLVKHEAVRATPYDDASGKVVNGKRVQTVGVGVSSHSPFYPKVGADGKVAPEDINSSFMRASNDAARAGRNMQRVVDLPNTAGFKLLSEMAYQGGNSFNTVPANKPYLEALRDKDEAKALAALKDTVPYKMAHDARKAYYEQMTKQALKRS